MISGPADQPDGGDKEYYDEDEGVEDQVLRELHTLTTLATYCTPSLLIAHPHHTAHPHHARYL